MFMSSQYLLKNSLKIRTSLIICHSQVTDSSLASVLFPEPNPLGKNDLALPSLKPATKQQTQNVVSSAADAAVNVLGVGRDAIHAVSNRISGLASSPRKISSTNKQLQSVVRVVTPENLEQRTKTLINSVKAATSTLSLATRIEELSNYLLHEPDANYFAKKVIKRLRQTGMRLLGFVFIYVGTTCTLFVVFTSTGTS